MTKRICSVTGCSRPHHSSGMCSTHGSRVRRTGSPHRLSPEEAFWSNVDRSQGEDGCWPWKLSTSTSGYGQVHTAGVPDVLAHRAAYMFVHGSIPDGLTLDHLCRNRTCVNPAHLEPVTSRVNTLRGETLPAISARKTECIHGHEFDEANTYRASDGSRKCKACINERTRRYRAARRAALLDA